MSRIPPSPPCPPRPAAGRARSRRAVERVGRVGVALLSVAIAGCAPPVPASPTPSTIASAGLASPGASPRPVSAFPGATSTAAAPSPTASPEPSPPGASLTPGGGGVGPDLLLLAFEGDAATLHLVRLSGEVVPLPVPDPSVAAVAPSAGGWLVAVLRDGRAFVAPGGAAGLMAGVGWRALALTGPGELPPGSIVWSATSSPDGTRLAAIARPRDAESPSALVVIEPTRGRRDVLPLAEGSEGIAPAWIDEARTAIIGRDRFDRPFVAIVAVATGLIVDRLPVRALAIATSRDARTWAFLVGDRVTVGPTASGLALRRPPDTGPATPPGDRVRGGIALSGEGRFLAIAVEEGDPGPSRIAIYERASEAWRAVTRVALPVSASGGWLTWLP